jgi:hypothetical protein
MKSVRSFFAIAFITAGLAGCAQPEKAVIAAKASRVGLRFDSVGNVSLHGGQPCTPQIMFDFQKRNSNASVYLAAGMHESKMLTDAAKHGKDVHVIGLWKRGRDKGCSYVEAKSVTLEK